jgi:hypothetical protein
VTLKFDKCLHSILIGTILSFSINFNKLENDARERYNKEEKIPITVFLKQHSFVSRSLSKSINYTSRQQQSTLPVSFDRPSIKSY